MKNSENLDANELIEVPLIYTFMIYKEIAYFFLILLFVFNL